jgi:shikimate dehydrogenase
VVQAQDLVAQFFSYQDRLTAGTLGEFPLPATISYNLVVNATPVGMAPQPDASPWPLRVAFPSQALVYDLVYNPIETRLVQQARAAGLSAVTGLGMLVEQAALAFTHWTGLEAPRQVMLESVIG